MMPTPIEAYRQGYEKGRSDSAGGRLAEVTMGMLRDDPGGHFQKGYSDGAAGKPFSPPSIPQRSLTKGLIPKFSENPFGWFFGVLIVIEFWVLWQLIKAPFQLVGSLMRGEKPSPWVIIKNVVVAGLVIALVWWVPHVNDIPATFGARNAIDTRVRANDGPLPSNLAATLPGGANVIEWADLSDFARKPRVLALWTINPQRWNRTPGAEGCSDSVNGDYWYGPTRLSLIDKKGNRIINTLEIRESDAYVGVPASDKFNIPFQVSNQYYYVPSPNPRGEGKPIILGFRNFTDATGIAFPLFIYEACGLVNSGAFGYSKRSDRVVQYPVEVLADDRPPELQLWGGNMFAQTPAQPGRWVFDLNPGHGSGVTIHEEISFDSANQRFVQRRTTRRVPE
jgi:hypothetical protein